MKSRLVLTSALCCLFAVALTSSAHAASLQVTDYKIISSLQQPPFSTVVPEPPAGPSTFQAGANPDAGSWSQFTYSGDQNEDIRTALTNFAPGLLGDPTSVPLCPEANLQADSCPADTRIGTSRLDTGPNFVGAPVVTASFGGTIYNAQPLGNEPGRLGVVTHVGPQTLVSSIPFYLTPRGAHDYGLTGILSDIARLDSPPPNLQVYGLSFILDGSQNKYVRNPTSCGANLSTGQAFGWDDPTTVDSPPYSYTTTGCENVPFGPTMSFSVGGRGNTRQFGYPTLNVKVSVPNNDGGLQGDIRSNVFTLPIELNSNNPVYHLCTQAQADADACPANSKFGNATATSPFLHEPVGGPIYLLEQQGQTLPGLLMDLSGRVHVKLQVSSKFVNGKQIQSVTTDAPQVPITELSLGLNGGRTNGVFQSRNDLCFRDGSTSRFRDVKATYSFGGWNGKSTATQTIRGAVGGCGPAVTAKLTGATGRRPSLKVTVKAHPDAPAMSRATLKLRSGLSASCKRLKNGAGGSASANNPLGTSAFKCVNSRTLQVTLPKPGARNVSVRLRRGALKVKGSVKRTLRRGKTKHLSIKVTPTPVSGQGTSTTAKFKVKGKKKR
jgi:hypothetical protein